MRKLGYDPRDEHDRLSPPRELRATAHELVGETFETRHACLSGIRDRIVLHDRSPEAERTRLHRKDDDVFLMAFARCKKMNPERAFEQYMHYCRFYQDDPTILDIDEGLVLRLYRSGSFGITRKTGAAVGYAITMKYQNLIPIMEEYGGDDILKVRSAVFFIFQTLAFCNVEVQIHGVVVLGDLTDYKLRDMSYMSFQQYRSCLDFLQWCLPLRTHGLYLLHEPTYVRATLYALRRFMSPLARNSFRCFGEDMKDFHEMIPKLGLSKTAAAEFNAEPLWCTTEELHEKIRRIVPRM